MSSVQAFFYFGYFALFVVALAVGYVFYKGN